MSAMLRSAGPGGAAAGRRRDGRRRRTGVGRPAGGWREGVASREIGQRWDGRRSGGLRVAEAAVFGEQSARPGRRPGRPRDTNSDETRWRILEAALDAFAERGYDGVSTREIARQAEVTSATVYHHFPSKFSLYQDAYRHAIDVAFGAYARAVAGRDSTVDEIDAVLDCSLQLMHERVAITSLAIHAQTDAVHPEMQEPELHESARAFIDGMIEPGGGARRAGRRRRRALRADAAGAAVGPVDDRPQRWRRAGRVRPGHQADAGGRSCVPRATPT